MNRIEKSLFGKYADKEIFRFNLFNRKGNHVSVINYGATIISWQVALGDGSVRNVVVGSDQLETYLNDTAYFGCTVGRYANRISNGRFSIDGTEYLLACNNGENHLHGGNRGFNSMLWEWELEEKEIPVLRLHYFSRDGEEGYPGNLDVWTEIRYTDADELVIEYAATTDKPTPINLTNHSYFNLTGDMQAGILDHRLQLNADQYTVVDKQQIPTGQLMPVQGGPLDFRNGKLLRTGIDQTAPGYDHNFILNKTGSAFSFAASLVDPSGLLELQVHTTEPGLQLYTGNLLNSHFQNRNGQGVAQYAALCLETQHYPDSPNHPHFPSTILKPGEQYSSKTVYQLLFS